MPSTTVQFDLRKKLAEAFTNGSYFITITVLDREKNMLNHFYAFENFKLDDLTPSLQKLASDVEMNEFGGRKAQAKPGSEAS
jgi:hypothetical protein